MLVAVPGFAAGWPPLGIARLKAILLSQGFHADTLCLSLRFTEAIATNAPDLSSIDAEAGEFGCSWHEVFFASLLFGHAAAEELLGSCVRDRHANVDIYRTLLGFDHGRPRRPESHAVTRDLKRIIRYCRRMHRFIDAAATRIRRLPYDYIGFSCLDTQFLTSLYLARRIVRSRADAPRVVFGGAMFQAYNAEGILQAFPEINHLCLGPGDSVLPDLLGRGGHGTPAERKLVAPPSRRHSPVSPAGGEPARPLAPDYEEFDRARLRDYSLTLDLGSGCSHSSCSFCGITTRGQWLREPETVVAEIEVPRTRHGPRSLNFADWEINGDPFHLERVCDLLIASGIRLDAWGEMNARNVSPRLLGKMRRAGISSIQVGIESFSERALRLMGKRASVLDNVKILKWSHAAGFDSVFFNLLCNHPGMTNEDATESLRVIRLIGHLIRPPVIGVVNEMSLYRTSRLYREADSFGVRGAREFTFHRRLFPTAEMADAIPMLGVEFDADAPAPAWRRVDQLLRSLRERPVRLAARVLRDGSTWIADSRSGHQRSYRLAGVEADVLWSCMDETPTVADLGDAVRLGRDPSWRIIRRLTRRGLLLHCDGMVLALPLRDPRSLRGGDARSISEGSTAGQIVGS